MNLLQEKRIKIGKTQQQIANELGVTSKTVTNYEHSRRLPMFKEIISIAKAYELTDEEIVIWLKQESN